MRTFHELHNELEELLSAASSGEKIDVKPIVDEIQVNSKLTETDKQILLKLSERVMQWGLIGIKIGDSFRLINGQLVKLK